MAQAHHEFFSFMNHSEVEWVGILSASSVHFLLLINFTPYQSAAEELTIRSSRAAGEEKAEQGAI